MPQDNSLKAFYDERAELAYAIEHPLQAATPAWTRRYANIQDEIHALEAAFARTWRLPSVNAAHTLPWCSICGRNDRALQPGRTLCVVCESIIATGAITPGEHAEAERLA